MKVYVIGVGMGNPDTLTVEAKRAIEDSDMLLGAPRMLNPFVKLDCEKHACMSPDVIARYVGEASLQGLSQVSVLVSGDVGLYSGAKALYSHLRGRDLEVIPGISTISYFCAKLRKPWQDATIVSAHGRSHNAAGAAQANKLTFCLTGGTTKVQDICNDLVERGLGGLSVWAGERLSYDGERIVGGTAAELAAMEFDNLAVLLVENPHPIHRACAAPILRDSDFTRGPVPMTKEEVRELAICKLRIAPMHTVWDIGAGTGSVSVEAALAANEGRVFAVERDNQALELLELNKARFGLSNMCIVPGEAPEALAGLPVPDRVFVGGSGGHLRQILRAVFLKNADVRVCVTAVTLETLAEILECKTEMQLHADIVQVFVGRAFQLAEKHLMKAENPVYIAVLQNGKDAPVYPVFAEAGEEGRL